MTDALATNALSESSVQYSEQAALTPQAVERLARLFILLASVTLPEDQEHEEASRSKSSRE